MWSGGTFTRANGASGWANDEAANIGIESARHDTQDNDFATGINNCLTKDGQNAATANLPMGGFAHTNVGGATARTQYARVAELQDGAYHYGGTSGGSANAQTISLTPAITTYSNGLTIRFIAGFSSTSSVTINVNGLGAKNIKNAKNQDPSIALIIAAVEYEIMYDSTLGSFVIIGSGEPSTMYRSASGAAATVSNSVTETTIYTTTIKGGLLVAGRAMEINVTGVVTNASGGGVAYTFRLKYGGTTQATLARTIPTGVTASCFMIRAIIAASAINSQQSAASIIYADVGAAQPPVTTDGTAGSVIDASADQTLAITGQMGTASASAAFSYWYANARLL